MNSRNFATENLLNDERDQYPTHPEYDTNVHVSPAVVRQNIAEEARINFNLSFKFNIALFIISLAKVIATLVVLSEVENICFGARQVWLLGMLFYDLFYASLSVLTIQSIIQMNQVLARHRMTLSYNLNHPNHPIPPPNAHETSSMQSLSDIDHDEIREYDVEQDHRSSRIAGMSSRSSRKHRIVKKLKKLSDNLYFVIFMIGQIIFFLGSGSMCDTTGTNRLMLVYIMMGYVWLLSPVFILLVGCVCLPFLLVVLYFFGRGNQVPASKVDIKNLNITTYKKSTPGNKECIICMLDYHEGDKIVKLDCSSMHHFHESCLKRWLKINGQCPICRTRIDEMQVNGSGSIQRNETNANDQTAAIRDDELMRLNEE